MRTLVTGSFQVRVLSFFVFSLIRRLLFALSFCSGSFLSVLFLLFARFAHQTHVCSIVVRDDTKCHRKTYVLDTVRSKSYDITAKSPVTFVLGAQ